MNEPLRTLGVLLVFVFVGALLWVTSTAPGLTRGAGILLVFGGALGLLVALGRRQSAGD